MSTNTIETQETDTLNRDCIHGMRPAPIIRFKYTLSERR
jgi:hypothetical protein